jgi:hypothetical protein
MNWLQNYYSQLSCICTVVVLKTSETVNCLDGRFLFLISPTLSQGASHSSFFARRMNKRALSSSWPILLWILKKPKGLQSLVLHLKADANGFYGKQASKQQQKDEFKCGFHGFWIIVKSDIRLPQQNYESVFTESFYEFPLPLLLFLEPRAKLSSPRWFATNISYVKQDKQRYDVRQIQQTTSQRKND